MQRASRLFKRYLLATIHKYTAIQGLKLSEDFRNDSVKFIYFILFYYFILCPRHFTWKGGGEDIVSSLSLRPSFVSVPYIIIKYRSSSNLGKVPLLFWDL